NKSFMLDSLKNILISSSGPIENFSKIKINSEDICENDIFLALKGEKDDGHNYIDRAIQKGAKGIISTQKTILSKKITHFYVNNGLLALQSLAKDWRAQFKALEVIGITGSVGKTTTKQISEKILATSYNVISSKKNYNNEIGLPLTILNIDKKTEIAILEMGMYQRGDIKLLTEISSPNIGAVINIEPVHIERVRTKKNIFLAKQELINGLSKNGTAIINNDDQLVRKMKKSFGGECITFGIEKKSTIYASNIIDKGLNGFSFNLYINNINLKEINIKQPGIHLLQCFLAAIAIGYKKQIEIPKIKKAIEKFELQERLQIIKLQNKITIIDDTYNASPSSMIGALRLLNNNTNYKIAILGDMQELGSLSEKLHKQVAQVAQECTDEIICLGDKSEIIYNEYRKKSSNKSTHFKIKKDLLDYLKTTKFQNTSILIKGSRFLKMEEIVQQLKKESIGDKYD
ncbi:MAG: UDP-N-acetylmuramoyl-tripeptide--D-alanyl-D-alanine ligase, partial [Dehalococcoidia bacterium]